MMNRSCLIHTARRAVYAQSLLDMFFPYSFGDGSRSEEELKEMVTSRLVKLCEVWMLIIRLLYQYNLELITLGELPPT